MKLNFYLPILFALVISSCQNGVELTPDNMGACTKKQEVQIDELLGDHIFTEDKTDSLFQFKIILKNKSIKNINSSEFMSRICALSNDTILKFPLPYMKINGTNHAVIFTNGNGQWGAINALVLIDLENKEILNVSCDSRSEAPVTKISFNDTTYTERYRNVQFNSISTQIDGVSGATETSDAFRKSIADGIKAYAEIRL